MLSVEEFSRLLVELQSNQRVSVDDNRLLIPRMVKDGVEKLRRSEAGSKGGNPVLVKGVVNHEVNGVVDGVVKFARARRASDSDSVFVESKIREHTFEDSSVVVGGDAPSITRVSDLVKCVPPLKHTDGCAPCSGSNGNGNSLRFDEWIKPWLQCADPDGACRAWISTVESPADEVGAFASRDRYLASEQVERGVWMEPAKFLFQQKTSKWSGKWPESRKAKAKQKPKPFFYHDPCAPPEVEDEEK
jgi:hypothetical protein